MDPRARRALRVALPLAGWAGLVVLAVLQGRGLRDADPSTGSVVLLGLWSLGAIACLYAALVQLLRARAEADHPPGQRRQQRPGRRPAPGPSDPPRGPRHRA